MEQTTSQRVERKKAASKRKVIAAAVELFNQHGVENATMEQIAEGADISRGTLYNYFPSKDAVVNAYLQQTFQDRSEDRVTGLRQLPDTRTRLHYLFTLLVEGVQRQKQIFEVFMVYRMKQVISLRPLEEKERSGLSQLVHEIITLGQQDHELRSDLEEDLLAGLFEYALIAAIKPLYLQPETYDQEKSIQQCVDLFLNGAKLDIVAKIPEESTHVQS
jgi:AcrR family transcriptional regulator